MIINGKEAKFHWGMIAFEIYRAHILNSVEKGLIFNSTSVISASYIIWGGIQNYYVRQQDDNIFTYSEIYDYVESKAIEGKEDESIVKCYVDFTESSAFKINSEKLINMNNEISDKKKEKKKK